MSDTTKFPAVAYHKDGGHVIVTDATHAKSLGDGYTDKPNEATVKALRKASGASKTDAMPGMIAPSTVEVY